MPTVTLTPKFEVVIPKKVRRCMELTAGTDLTVLQIGDRIEMVRLKPIQMYRGFLKGIDTDVPRDEDRI